MARAGRPLKYATPLTRVLVRLLPHELQAIDAQPGTVRNDKIRDLLAEALAKRP
jgi:hypothetical protein